jgi:hypothetical protein
VTRPGIQDSICVSRTRTSNRRGPQAMYRALMPSQWLLLMLSHCQPIFQPHLYLIRHMLHPRTSLSQLWIRRTDQRRHTLPWIFTTCAYARGVVRIAQHCTRRG